MKLLGWPDISPPSSAAVEEIPMPLSSEEDLTQLSSLQSGVFSSKVF